MNKLTRLNLLSGTVLSVSILFTYFLESRFPPRSIDQSVETQVIYTDTNSDGIEDIVLQQEDGKVIVLIGKGNDMYERTEMKTQEGFPFYKNEKGTYDFGGHYWKKE